LQSRCESHISSQVPKDHISAECSAVNIGASYGTIT